MIAVDRFDQRIEVWAVEIVGAFRFKRRPVPAGWVVMKRPGVPARFVVSPAAFRARYRVVRGA